MRLTAVINATAGTVAKMSPVRVADRLKDIWTSLGHDAEGKDIGRVIRKACAKPSVEAVVIGGGDGTLSQSLKHVVGSEKAQGSMNYTARQFGIPFDLEQAAKVLAQGNRFETDIGRVNERMFPICA